MVVRKRKNKKKECSICRRKQKDIDCLRLDIDSITDKWTDMIFYVVILGIFLASSLLMHGFFSVNSIDKHDLGTYFCDKANMTYDSFEIVESGKDYKVFCNKPETVETIEVGNWYVNVRS